MIKISNQLKLFFELKLKSNKIGETGRNFKTRCAEHKRDLYPRNLAKIDDNNINKKTALFKHIVKFDHKINWLGSSILTFEPDFYKRHFL